MKIIYSPIFERELIDIIDFIAKDKPEASINFALELEKYILDIPNNPLKYRKSIYFNNDNIRDMIYKKYTIVYEINREKECIEILAIFNKNKPLTAN